MLEIPRFVEAWALGQSHPISPKHAPATAREGAAMYSRALVHKTQSPVTSGIGIVSPHLTRLRATLVVNRFTFGFALTMRDMSSS